MRDMVIFYLTRRNRGRKIWSQSSRKVLEDWDNPGAMFWEQGCTSELDSEEVVLVCMSKHLENDVYRKVQGCMQASWRYIWKCRPQQGRVSTNQYLTYQLPWFCPGSGGKGTWARKESGRLLNGWIVCRCTCLAIYLVINLDSLLVLLFKT